MKKVIFFFLFAFVLGMGAASAQTCHAAGKACCANKTACAEKASKAASADPNIETRKNADGSVAYVRKQADQQGNVEFVSVQYDESSNTFVNAAPKMLVTDKTEMTKESVNAAPATGSVKACCAGGEGKACCAKKGSSSCSGEKKAEQ